MRTLQKWHGAGNDFVVDVVSGPTGAQWTPELARSVCDRHTGVGADGLLVATVREDESVDMILFNGDGSLAEMSGNGARCLAGAVVRARHSRATDVVVHTVAGERIVHLELRDGRGWGSVAMGLVTLYDPLPGTLGVAGVGNPHCVVADDDGWSDRERETLAADLARTLGGANVEFIRFESPDRITMRVIERGAGWTLACGTGSCAVAAVSRHLGRSGDRVTVANPGGDLVVSLRGDEAILEGPVEFIADVDWSES